MPDFPSIREKIQRELAERVLPSLAVAVARDGEILWEEAFGWADREARIPADEHTLYSLASISKPITATALLLLVERGRVDLDAPINEYLGDAPLVARAGDASDATVRRVASHTAGLPGHCHCFYDDEPFRRPSREETIRRYGNLVNPPGERYWYSNLGYGLLDHLISRVSGAAYDDFMREELFLPLGMTRSSVNVGPGLEPYAAARYGLDGIRYPDYRFDHPGGSEVYCSVHDLIRFAMFHMSDRLPDQKRLLADDSLAEMRKPVPLLEGSSNYGVGWRTDDDYFGFRRITHDGSMGGVSTTLQLFPDERLAVAVLCNARTGFHHEIAHDLLAALLSGYGERREDDRIRREERQEDAEAPFAPGPDLLGKWTGAIHVGGNEVPLKLDVRESGDIRVQVGNDLIALLNEPGGRDGVLTGVFLGDLGEKDSLRLPYALSCHLKRRGDSLCGAVIAFDRSEGPDGGAPRRRMGNALGYWAEAKRSSEA
jgi:CubicO group peptidase (beta-lactamase class C family)